MRNFIDIVEKIVHRDTIKYSSEDWKNTVVAINPTKAEFWSENFRQAKNGASTEFPSAAGVFMQNGTIVVGDGHSLSHEDICDCAGLDINDEKFRLQIYNEKVYVEIWISEDLAENDSPLEQKIEAAQKTTGMDIREIKSLVASKTSRFVPGWIVVCLLWTEYHQSVEV